MTKQVALPVFENHDVANAQIRIVKCGDGLSAALEVDPKALQLGDLVSYVLTGVVSQINHRDKEGVVTRLHTVETTAIAEVERDIAEKILIASAEETERKRAERDGQLLLGAEHAAEERERADEASTGNARSTQDQD